MTKTEQIINAIEMAEGFQSKLTPEALAVPGFTSLKIRHLMNNLGAISTHFGEIGSHVGGTFCSAIFQNDNLIEATSVDSFVEFNAGNPMQELLSNVTKFKPGPLLFKLIAQDCWNIKEHPTNIDFFCFDGEHSFESQRKAMTHFLPWMADEFIFVIDDFCTWDFVKKGTVLGLAESGCTVLFEKELYNGIPGDNSGWHQGFGVFLLKKP